MQMQAGRDEQRDDFAACSGAGRAAPAATEDGELNDDDIVAPPPPLEHDAPVGFEGAFWYEQGRYVRDDASGKLVWRGLTTQEHAALLEIVGSGFFTRDVLESIVAPFNNERDSRVPRARRVEWAIIGFAKMHRSVHAVTDADGSTRIVNVFVDYSRDLKRLHRLLFDFFRRTKGAHPAAPVWFDLGDERGERYEWTTVAQLNFLRWYLRNGIDKYVAAHADEIEAHARACRLAREAAEGGEEPRAPKKRGRSGGADSNSAASSPAESTSKSAADDEEGTAAEALPVAAPKRRRRRRELAKAPLHARQTVALMSITMTGERDDEIAAARAALERS